MNTLSQADVEDEIMRLAALCEKATHAVADRARAAAQADADYKIGHAKAFLQADGPVAEREAKALTWCEDEYRARRMTEAVLLAAQEAGRNYRSQLEALRSICANMRSLVTN